jgi:hypothetical protein
MLRPGRGVAGGGGAAVSASVISSIGTAPMRPLTGSPDAADYQVARRVAEKVEEQVPDVREDVVASLRARIESGNYQVSGEQVAEMMVRRLLADRVR